MGKVCKQILACFVCYHRAVTLQVAKAMCNCETRGGEKRKSCVACNHGIEDKAAGWYFSGQKWLLSFMSQFQIKHNDSSSRNVCAEGTFTSIIF